MIAFLNILQQSLLAQAAESTPDLPKPMEQSMQLLQQGTGAPHGFLFQQFLAGGFFVWMIGLVSLTVIALAAERYLTLRFRYYVNGQHLFNEIKKFVMANDLNRAIETCRQMGAVPLARVLGAGLQNSSKSESMMDSAMEAEALYFLPKIQERLGYISSFANIGLLLGLLGTIGGLIQAFQSAGGESVIGSGREAELAAGIGTAMFATAMGLCVAIPALFFHQVLSNKSVRIIDDIQHYAAALKHLIQQVREPG